MIDHEQTKRLFVAAHSTAPGTSRKLQIDTLLATAAVDRVGLALLRLRFLNDANEFGTACALLQPIVRRKIRKAGCTSSGTRERQVVVRALRTWLVAVCPVCEGRRKPRVPGTPVLADEDCTSCDGMGVVLRSPLTDPIEREQWAQAITVFNNRLTHAIGALRGRLNRSEVENE